MFEKSEQDPCVIAGLEYPPGSVVCRSGVCERCNGGVWEETGELCPC